MFLFFCAFDKSPTNPPLCVSVDMCAGGPCVEHDHCKEGLYCYGYPILGGYYTMNCAGICKSELRRSLAITQTLPIVTHACLTTARSKKDGEKVGRKSIITGQGLYYDYRTCEGGSGACGYCSSTCDTEKGCNIVPFRMFHITSFLFLYT